jgi:acyl CoA:acetate/3-ketoacid CoA transferase beta subunit
MATGANYTTDDLMCVCISRQVEDGEMLAQGIATPLVAAGYLLARLTHAPNVVFASAIGNVLCRQAAPLGLTRVEELWLGHALSSWGFCEAACEMLPTLAPKEFFRPAQVDPYGQTNNVVFGDYLRPRMRLPGSGGIPDVSPYHPRAYLYVPRHSRAVFVESLDFVSGLGVPTPSRPGHRPGPRMLISDLGTFDFWGGRMRVRTIHPGISLQQIQTSTGFALSVAPDISETPPPDPEEVRLLRQVVDPLGIRELERMSGARRRQRLREIVHIERAATEQRLSLRQ